MKILTKKMRLRPEFPFQEMVKLTPGYVGADIQTLCKEASIIAVERIVNGEQATVKQRKIKSREELTNDQDKDPEAAEAEESD